MTRDAPGAAGTPGDPWTGDEERAAAKRILWRDSATILIAVIVALLAIQLLFRGAGGVGPASDETALPTGLILGPSGPRGSDAPMTTPGDVLEPSFGVDVRPTSSPALTLPPTGSQRPVKTPPKATARPPTPRPATPPPTVPPTVQPTAIPTDSPPPPPESLTPPAETVTPTTEPTASPSP